MKIKKYEAGTLRLAMDMAQKELGEDAVILNSREIKRPGSLLNSHVELVAAVDDIEEQVSPPMESFTENLNQGDLAAEVGALRAALESLVGEGVLIANTRARSGPERKLRDAGVEPALASQIARSVISSQNSADLAKQWSCLFTCSQPNLVPDEANVFALVGPTGVGKTSVIGKMAAVYRFQQGCKVAIISCDTARIGAMAQLETIASALGSTFRSCSNAQDLIRTINELSDHNVILVDTPGGSALNPQYVGQLRDLIIDPRIKKILVLPANMAADSRSDAVRAFSVVDPQRLIITKLDEAASPAAILSISQASKTALAFLTDSPDIPGRLIEANPEVLSEAVLTGIAS